MAVCSVPGCPTLTTTGRCSQHQRQAEQQRGSAAARGYNHRWRQTRGRYLKYHPDCQHPDCNAPAVDVHHLDGQGPNGPAGHKWTNLQGLCRSHHAQITARTQPGGWNI